MSPEQTIAALSKELHLGFFQHGAQLFTTVSKEQLETFATRIAQQAIAEHLAKLQGDWLRSGDLLYRQGEGQSVINKDMIQVMVADGSYDLGKRAEAAAVLHKLLDVDLAAKQQESAPVLPELPEISDDTKRLDFMLDQGGFIRVQGNDKRGWCVMDCGYGLTFTVDNKPTAREAIDAAIAAGGNTK